MSVFDCVEERLLLYSGMVYHSYGLWTWYFSGEGELYYTNCPHEKELLHFFQLGNCQEFALSRRDEPEMPFLMSDPVGLVWLGEYIPCVDTERRFFVIGPAFCDRDSLTGIDDALRRRNLSKEFSGGCRHLLHNLPVVDVKQFQHLARSLHYAIGFVDGEDMKLLMQVSDGMKTDLTEAEKWIDYEQEHHRERMLLTYVRDGNHGYGDLLDLFTRGAHMGHPGQSPERSARNTVLIFISQCARAAMEGGVPVKTAKETENMFVGRAEEQKTVTELIRLCREMMDTFIDQVIVHKEYASLSKPVYLCCDYIRTHLSEPVT